MQCLVLLLAMSQCAVAQVFPTPLSPGGTYDPSVPSPQTILGFVPGESPARYDQVVTYLRALAQTSPRVRLMEMGKTHEGHVQYYLVITTPERFETLDSLRDDLRSLGDPRTLTDGAMRRITDSHPAVVWIGYGIHGDELSSVDAALHVAYQLAAGTDQTTLSLLKTLIVCIDPMENPDGRERFLAQMEQWKSLLPNPDTQSLNHTGVWPYGRGNHYLFDLNRDWFVLIHPETQNRVRAVLRWQPHVFIDSHEMGPHDTYLFSPARQPINANFSAIMRRWISVFSGDQARAFDRHGWSYYTREWNDDWYPGYANSWASYYDAVGILYEQAGVDGSLVKRPDGTILSYRESVDHHVVSSLANLETASRNRKALLEAFVESRKQATTVAVGVPHAYYLLPGDNAARTDHLVQRLLWLGIEVHRAERELVVRDAAPADGGATAQRTMPAGTYIVRLDQPHSRIARAILEFDPRMLTSFLQEERKSLEKEQDSRLYDVTAWSLPLAYGIEAYASASMPSGAIAPVHALTPPAGKRAGPATPYGYLFDYDDRGVKAVASLLQEGWKVRSARLPFQIEGRQYGRGTVLLRVRENGAGLHAAMNSRADSMGIVVHAVGTALSTSGPDLGGNDFILLREPRIALVGGPETSITSFGALWHMFEDGLHMRVSLLPLQSVANADLRKYTVLVLPSTTHPQRIQSIFGKEGLGKLRDWVESGGTLVAMGNGAAFLADTGTGMSAVRLRRQSLKDIGQFARATEWESKAGAPVIDSVALWKGTMGADSVRAAKEGTGNEKDLALLDERARLFMPRGAILRVELDEEHWLTFGAGKTVPAIVLAPYAYLAKDPVRTPARFSEPAKLRLSGLLWPEARDRWARTCYATREGKGRGQIVLFAGEPVFRGFFHGTERLLINAVLLGPGWGSDAGIDW